MSGKNDTKHTPGPWKLTEHDERSARIESRLEFIARIEGIDWGSEECKANARLIAAAPDLLEALKNLLWQHDNNAGQLCGMALQDARAAIAKAEGEKQA